MMCLLIEDFTFFVSRIIQVYFGYKQEVQSYPFWLNPPILQVFISTSQVVDLPEFEEKN